MLRNSTEPDGHNNGKDHVDDAGTAHAFMAAKEEAMYGEHGEARPLRARNKRSRCSSGKAVEAACVKRSRVWSGSCQKSTGRRWTTPPTPCGCCRERRAMTDLLTLPKLTLTPRRAETTHVVKLDQNLGRVVHERVQEEHPSLRVSKRWALEYALLQWLGVNESEAGLNAPGWQVVVDDETEERIEAAVELALTTLAQVAATGNNDEKVRASVALLQGAQVAWEGARKAAVTSRVLPLLEAVGKNLAGQLTESDPYAPVYGLEPSQQASIVMALAKEVR